MCKLSLSLKEFGTERNHFCGGYHGNYKQLVAFGLIDQEINDANTAQKAQIDVDEWYKDYLL